MQSPTLQGIVLLLFGEKFINKSGLSEISLASGIGGAGTRTVLVATTCNVNPGRSANPKGGSSSDPPPPPPPPSSTKQGGSISPPQPISDPSDKSIPVASVKSGDRPDVPRGKSGPLTQQNAPPFALESMPFGKFNPCRAHFISTYPSGSKAATSSSSRTDRRLSPCCCAGSRAPDHNCLSG